MTTFEILIALGVVLLATMFMWGSISSLFPSGLGPFKVEAKGTVEDVDDPTDEATREKVDKLLGGLPRRFVTVPTVSRGRLLMHLVDAGPRDAEHVAVLVHGNPAWSYLWRKVASDLSGSAVRCVAPDLLGFGLSDKPRDTEAHSLAGHIDAVATAVLHVLGDDGSKSGKGKKKRVVVLGQDWGGPIGVGLARRLSAAGHEIQGIVLGNTSVSPPRQGSRATAFHRFSRLPFLPSIVFRVAGFPVSFGMMARAQGNVMDPGINTEAYALPFARGAGDRAGPLALARMVPGGGDESHPSVAELRSIETWARGFKGKVALVWGKKDPILGRALRGVRSVFAGRIVSESETDAGHFLQEQVPNEFVTAAQQISFADFLNLF